MQNSFGKDGYRPFDAFAALDALDNAQLKSLNTNEISETAFFESVDDQKFLESMEKVASANLRADGSAAVMAWIDGGDSDFDELDAICFGLAGSGEDDDELSEDEADDYNEILKAAAEFISTQCGVESSIVSAMFSGDDDAAETAFEAVESVLSDSNRDDLVAEFAVKESLMMEALKKVVRNGEVVLIRTNKKKRRMTAAQKAALKKARRKAHSAAGKASRRKALKLRKSRGL